jgi:hypothetical protein
MRFTANAPLLDPEDAALISGCSGLTYIQGHLMYQQSINLRTFFCLVPIRISEAAELICSFHQ